MQFKHIQSIHQVAQSEGIVKVTAICWAPNGKRLAVCTTDRVVLMFDEDGVKKDKFSTKPADKVTLSSIIVKLIVDNDSPVGT
jgi:intraflagellar transport protein 172